jgi:competence protein ComEA
MRARILPLIFAGAVLLVAVACSNQSPQQLREKTAEETAALKRDTTAVVEGVKDGLTDKSGTSASKLVDINKASKDELTKLPGIDGRRADKIIAERLYSDKYQIVTRGALSDKEYEKIQDQITISR